MDELDLEIIEALKNFRKIYPDDDDAVLAEKVAKHLNKGKFWSPEFLEAVEGNAYSRLLLQRP